MSRPAGARSTTSIPMNNPGDRLARWSAGAPEGEYAPIYCGPRTEPMTHVISVPSWVAETIVARHNAEVDAALAHRPSVDIEAVLTRVLTAALRELLRGLLPRWWRRNRHAH